MSGLFASRCFFFSLLILAFSNLAAFSSVICLGKILPELLFFPPLSEGLPGSSPPTESVLTLPPHPLSSQVQEQDRPFGILLSICVFPSGE